MRAERFARRTAASVGIAGALLLLCGCAPREDKLAIDPPKAYVDAKAVLLQGAEDRDPVVRANALEALAATLGDEAGAVFAQGLGDADPMVRFAAAMAVEDTKYAPARTALEKMASDKDSEPDKRVFCAVVCALYALGNDRHAGELGPLLFDPEREVRMDAALAMGRMGEPSAVGPLQTLLSDEQDDGVKIAVTEALAMLGDARSAEVIEAYTKGYFLDLRLAATPALGRSGSPRTLRALTELLEDRNPVRVRVAAAGELARLGQVNDRNYDLCLSALKDPQRLLTESNKRARRAVDTDAASLKQLAAIALGWMGRLEAVGDLHPVLRSPNGTDRVAAGMSILRLVKAYRPAEAPAAAPATQPAKADEPPPAAPKTPKLHTAGGKD